MEPAAEFRKSIRNNTYTKHTSGLFAENIQVNVVILPERHAEEFSEFCALNPIPCPVIFQSSVGQTTLSELGDIDIRTDIPAYNIYRYGTLSEEKADILNEWQTDFVCFCIGCSFTFDKALTDAGIRLKHIEHGCNVSMYKTTLPLKSTPLFKGTTVTSMRWIHAERVANAIAVSERFADFHGKPLHCGNPSEIGIADIGTPDYGDYVAPDDHDIPVFWGCGVTPQACLVDANLPIVITHKPGSMLITDLTHCKTTQTKPPKETL